ncbi:AraC family transcriptional regulator, partial [Mesorhizobium sp. M00.F.Ca.ET.038.03.1.1]
MPRSGMPRTSVSRRRRKSASSATFASACSRPRPSTMCAHAGMSRTTATIFSWGSTAAPGRRSGPSPIAICRCSAATASPTTSPQPCRSFTDGVTSWVLASIPRASLLRQVPHADDRPVTRLDPASPAVRHLERTIDFLLQSEELDGEPGLSHQAGTALADLIVLALGARGDAAEIAIGRGLRAARLREALAVIEARFADPALSTETVARAVGLSRRYLNTLLLESGRTFAERVLELRLQKACAMLSDVRNDAAKVSDIALAAGFNDVSYFNRRFQG